MAGPGRRQARRAKAAEHKAEREIAKLQDACDHEFFLMDEPGMERCRKCRLVRIVRL